MLMMNPRSWSTAYSSAFHTLWFEPFAYTNLIVAPGAMAFDHSRSRSDSDSSPSTGAAAELEPGRTGTRPGSFTGRSAADWKFSRSASTMVDCPTTTMVWPSPVRPAL